MLTDEQQNQLKDILRLIPPDEQAAFLDMLAHDLRGRDLDRGELRRVAEHTWRKFLQHGWPMRIWAAAYLWLGALDSPIDALLYSVDAMSTRGESGLTLQRPWRMMGALEAVNGMLLFGVSTAYVFAVMQVLWGRIERRRRL